MAKKTTNTKVNYESDATEELDELEQYSFDNSEKVEKQYKEAKNAVEQVEKHRQESDSSDSSDSDSDDSDDESDEDSGSGSADKSFSTSMFGLLTHISIHFKLDIEAVAKETDKYMKQNDEETNFTAEAKKMVKSKKSEPATCTRVLKSGNNKGKQCGKVNCKQHKVETTTTESESVKKPVKSESKKSEPSTCASVLKSGKNKGKQCGKVNCKQHKVESTTGSKSDESESESVSEEKSKSEKETCTVVLKSGKNKGKQCGKVNCKQHKVDGSTESESKSVKSVKPAAVKSTETELPKPVVVNNTQDDESDLSEDSEDCFEGEGQLRKETLTCPYTPAKGPNKGVTCGKAITGKYGLCCTAAHQKSHEK